MKKKRIEIVAGFGDDCVENGGTFQHTDLSFGFSAESWLAYSHLCRIGETRGRKRGPEIGAW